MIAKAHQPINSQSIKQANMSKLRNEFFSSSPQPTSTTSTSTTSASGSASVTTTTTSGTMSHSRTYGYADAIRAPIGRSTSPLGQSASIHQIGPVQSSVDHHHPHGHVASSTSYYHHPTTGLSGMGPYGPSVSPPPPFTGNAIISAASHAAPLTRTSPPLPVPFPTASATYSAAATATCTSARNHSPIPTFSVSVPTPTGPVPTGQRNHSASTASHSLNYREIAANGFTGVEDVASTDESSTALHTPLKVRFPYVRTPAKLPLKSDGESSCRVSFSPSFPNPGGNMRHASLV